MYPHSVKTATLPDLFVCSFLFCLLFLAMLIPHETPKDRILNSHNYLEVHFVNWSNI